MGACNNSNSQSCNAINRYKPAVNPHLIGVNIPVGESPSVGHVREKVDSVEFLDLIDGYDVIGEV
jgi:hypothetical protein